MIDAGTLELIEIDQALDFNPACEFHGENVARWFAKQPCCGKSFLLCQLCRDIESAVQHGDWACKHCFASCPSTIWKPLP